MASGHSDQNSWLTRPPAKFDIVTARFPESRPKGQLRLRPCLVLEVLKGATSGLFACKIAYGTKSIDFMRRRDVDLIIQNAADIHAMGLSMATRFDLDEKNIVTLPWNSEFFGCWSNHSHPRIGSLTEKYVREFAFSMMIRENLKQALEEERRGRN